MSTCNIEIYPFGISVRTIKVCYVFLGQVMEGFDNEAIDFGQLADLINNPDNVM